MKFVIFLFAVTVATVTGFPFVPTDVAGQRIADVAQFKENILSELKKDISKFLPPIIATKGQKTENKDAIITRSSLDSILPSPAFEIFGVKISGKINIQIEFADTTALEEAKAELEQIIGKNDGGSTKTGYPDTIKIKFNEEDLIKLMQKELAKSTMKIKDMAQSMKFEPIKMKDIEIIPSKIDDSPETEVPKFPLTISGKINSKIRFVDPTSNEQLSPNDGEILIQGKGGDKNGNNYVAHTAEFHAKKLSGLQLEKIATISKERAQQLFCISSEM